jgi:hypothetical protein
MIPIGKSDFSKWPIFKNKEKAEPRGQVPEY